MAQSHQDTCGAATSIGEQPLKGLIDPEAMARLALGEALTNLVFARATALEDVKVGEGGRGGVVCFFFFFFFFLPMNPSTPKKTKKKTKTTKNPTNP
jgi:hypothetical protein